jgi:hypothetical protein
MMATATEVNGAPTAGVFITMMVLYVVGYCVPLAIALIRKHPQTGAIVAVNLLLGWTFIGWVVAFVWALTNPRKDAAPVIVHTYAPPPGWYPPEPPQEG